MIQVLELSDYFEAAIIITLSEVKKYMLVTSEKSRNLSPK